MGHSHKKPWRELEPGEKYCCGCDRILTQADFFKDRGKKDGLMSHCKRCDSFKQMRYQNKNKKRLRRIKAARLRKYRAEHPGYNARMCLLYSRRRMVRRIERVIGVQT